MNLFCLSRSFPTRAFSGSWGASLTTPCDLEPEKADTGASVSWPAECASPESHGQADFCFWRKSRRIIPHQGVILCAHQAAGKVNLLFLQRADLSEPHLGTAFEVADLSPEFLPLAIEDHNGGE